MGGLATCKAAWLSVVVDANVTRSDGKPSPLFEDIFISFKTSLTLPSDHVTTILLAVKYTQLIN